MSLMLLSKTLHLNCINRCRSLKQQQQVNEKK